MTGISDTYNRPVNYLRISVTDRCNLRCVYCMPPAGIGLLKHNEILSYEEITEIVRCVARLGISKIRLTGGEPLVRANLPELISQLAAIEGIEDISLTSNGTMLGKFASELKKAGLKRVNISLDTLDPAKFEKITRQPLLKLVMEGIESAREAGLNPVKINMVVMKNLNDDEIVNFARLSITDGWNVRFIELMPFSTSCMIEHESAPHSTSEHPRFVSAAAIKDRLQSMGELQPCKSIEGAGPARYYRYAGTAGSIGFITPVSEHFCFKCNRLRLTSDGKLRPCLLHDNEIDLRETLRNNPGDIERLVRLAIESKPHHHNIKDNHGMERTMSSIGG